MAGVLSLMVLTTFALVAGAIFLWRRGGSHGQVALMLVLAAVIAVNIAILAVPDSGGNALIGREPEDRR